MVRANYDAQARIYEVDPPNFDTEQPKPYYTYAPKRLKEVIGRSLVRYTLVSHLTIPRKVNGRTEKRLFPVKKGGPFVRIPVAYHHTRVETTAEAMDRFTAAIRRARRELGLDE